MPRLPAASALFALALLTATATGQPPVKLDPPPPATKLDPKPANSADRADAAVAAALANDPDVKMAQAKIQLAEAELAKARQSAALKVLSLKARADQAKAEVRAAEVKLAHTEQLGRAATVPQSEVLAARDRLEAAKAALAAVEAELRLLTGAGAARPSRAADPAVHAALVEWALASCDNPGPTAELWFEYLRTARPTAAVKGPVSDRLRAALDKPVKLSSKGEAVSFTKALEAFKKEAGLDIAVRPMPSPELVVRSEGEELPVGAWFQLFADTGGRQSDGLAFYVREYGLLVANRQTAPPDAPTLTEFWKQKPPAPKPETRTDPLVTPHPLPGKGEADPLVAPKRK